MNDDHILFLEKVAKATIDAIPKRKKWKRGWNYTPIGKPKRYMFSVRMKDWMIAMKGYDIGLIDKPLSDLNRRLTDSFASKERNRDIFIGFVPIELPLPGTGVIGVSGVGERGLFDADTARANAVIFYDISTITEVVCSYFVYQAFERKRGVA
jgi:hypothetical protein